MNIKCYKDVIGPHSCRSHINSHYSYLIHIAKKKPSVCIQGFIFEYEMKLETARDKNDKLQHKFRQLLVR